MCGIAGIVGLPEGHDPLIARMQRMLPLLAHRGPDDSGLVSPSDGVALGHTRLAILDLSSLGHQPMTFQDDRYSIVFNGEIYNFQSLRAELEAKGRVFRSHTDTEVILQLYDHEGASCVGRLQGMFAFAIWDSLHKSLFMARDPLGIKPLYVWNCGGRIAFASELRALLKAEMGEVSLNPQALFNFFRFGSVPEPETLVANVSMLEAGHWMTWKAGEIRTQKYWSLQLGRGEKSDLDPVSAVRSALLNSIERHFVSDVPVGIFLSGGVDSTCLLALAHTLGHKDLHTYCISFDENELNEGDLAQRTAQHFGARHTDWRLSAAEGRQLIADYLGSMDQPSNDGFNTFCISRLANRSGMKVVLSGLGGDELFAGYPSFDRIPRLLQIHRTLRVIPGLQSIGGYLARECGGPKGGRIADFLRSKGTVVDAWSAMRGFFTWHESTLLVRQLSGQQFSPDPEMTGLSSLVSAQPTLADQISACEIAGYMRNQLLRDSDVMSMKWGLELRVPFVDQALVDSVSMIPADLRLARGKKILLDAVPEIPHWIREQPKRGFRFPFETWIQNDWMETFETISRSSVVDPVSWYRKWCLFVVHHFIRTIGLTSSV
jgi:asparagine synthase (glutamine-hydrolysing)